MYKLLIADDEFIEKEAIKYIVGNNFAGLIELCEASNGREMIEKAVAFKPDIIFTDIKMPGINGLEAATKIREALPECRIIIMSAFNYFNFAKEAVTIGVDDYIVKPVPDGIIINTLNKAIQHINENRLKRKKEEETNLKLKNVTQYLEEELIFLMSSGEIEESAAKEFFDILEIECTAFICATISFSGRSLPGEVSGEVQKRILKKRLIEKLKTRLSERNIRFFQGAIGQYIYLLLLVDEAMDEYKARVLWAKSFSEIKDEVFNEMHISMSIGIGNQCTSISQIYSSFLQAKIALKYESTPGSVISYGDISVKNTNTAYPLNKERSLLESFLQGNDKTSLQTIEELIDWMEINLQGIENIKHKIYESLLVLIRETGMNLNIMEFDEDCETMRRNLFLFDSTRELRAFAKNYIQNKIIELNNIKASRTNSLLSLLTKFIDENFDKDISLESVSDVIKVSPFYLSKLFKKETGMNFIDYLTEFRIKKAKEFLSSPTNNVKDVCFMVGYKDPNYFARVFKKVCGITPTEYRDKKL